MEPSDEICIGSTSSGRVAFTVGDRTVAILTVEDARRAALCLAGAIGRAFAQRVDERPQPLTDVEKAVLDAALVLIRRGDIGLARRVLTEPDANVAEDVRAYISANKP
jgi:hypothetical protein